MTEEQFLQKRSKDISRITVCFCQPRSGSTLLMRLMGIACGTRIRGDINPKFISHWIGLNDEIQNDKGQHGYLSGFEKDGVLADRYREWSAWRDLRAMNDYYLKSLLLGGTSGFLKVNNIGFGNDLVEPFVEALRGMADRGHVNLQIAFLYRDHDEIIKSLIRKWKDEKMFPDVSDEGLTAEISWRLNNQRKQFDEAFQLGDRKIQYHQIIESPKEILLKLNPWLYPKDSNIHPILAKKIK